MSYIISLYAAILALAIWQENQSTNELQGHDAASS